MRSVKMWFPPFGVPLLYILIEPLYTLVFQSDGAPPVKEIAMNAGLWLMIASGGIASIAYWRYRYGEAPTSHMEPGLGTVLAYLSSAVLGASGLGMFLWSLIRR